jgi:hypothetical protein
MGFGKSYKCLAKNPTLLLADSGKFTAEVPETATRFFR